MLRARERLSRPPVVGDFVIVPLRDDRNFAIEGEHIPVEQIVFVVAAKLGQRLGRLRLILADEVFPDLAIRHLLLGRDRAVGIDVVAVVDEKIGPIAKHGGIGAHAAATFVDPPTLAGGIARPYERQRAPVCRRGAKAADLRLAHDGG